MGFVGCLSVCLIGKMFFFLFVLCFVRFIFVCSAWDSFFHLVCLVMVCGWLFYCPWISWVVLRCCQWVYSRMLRQFVLVCCTEFIRVRDIPVLCSGKLQFASWRSAGVISCISYVWPPLNLVRWLWDNVRLWWFSWVLDHLLHSFFMMMSSRVAIFSWMQFIL